MDGIKQACTDLYSQIYEGPPKHGSMITPDGETVYIYWYDPTAVTETPRGGDWKPLCPVVSGDPAERVEFEIFPDLIIESDPHGLMEVILAAQGIEGKTSVETVDLFFKLLKECGWVGPLTQIPGKAPGDVFVVRRGGKENISTPNIKPVLSQLRNPEFTGILEVPTEDGSVFVNLKDVHEIWIEEEVEEEG